MITYLPTKLYRPTLPANLVARPTLVAQLSRGLAREYKLSLVVAPAGFGKTTLVNEWLQQYETASGAADLGKRIAWLSLDAMDNELAHFFQHVVTAVQNVFPTTGVDSLRLLQTPQLPPLAYLSRILLHEWATLPGECLLVLEDYHTITETSIHQFIAQLLDHLPSQIHLVLLSRTEPPLPLARLRVRQQMTEIRAADLCFSQDEARTFLTQTLGRSLNPESVTALHTRTEGWIAGLQLAALTLTGAVQSTSPNQGGETTFVRTFAGSNRHVMAYLMEEVLAQQPQTVQIFLLRTALLERFCASLTEALFQSVRGQEGQEKEPLLAPPLTHRAVQSILGYLIQNNLFIVPLDDDGEWYRYHHLFRDLLRHHLRARINAAELATLHRRASTWLADQGWIEEAIRHALAGGDEITAARLVEQRRHELLNQENWRTLDRWLALLPETLIQQRAALLMVKVYVFTFQFKLAAIPPLLQAAASHLQDPTLTEAEVQLLQVEIDLERSQIWYWQNEGQQSLALVQQGLERLPVSCLYMRSGALLYLGLAAQMTGQSAVALQILRATLENEHGQPNTLVARVLLSLALMHYFAGELTPMRQTAQDLLVVATRANLALSIAWAHYMLGVVAYEWNELATAAQHFADMVELRYNSNSWAIHNGWLRLAWIEQVQGRSDQAQQQVTALLHFHHEQSNLTFLPVVYSFQARLALQQNDLIAATRWAQTAHLDPPRGPLVNFESPLLTRAKILLAEGSQSSLAAGHVDVTQLRQLAEYTHNTIRLIEILAVQALIEAAQDQTELALATLQRAVLLAKPGRSIRTFVDLGPALAGLLYELIKRNIETEYLSQVLVAFPASLALTDPAQQVRRAAQTTLIEPLTERESEVLLHLQQGLANKAIARVLNISVLTVKKHTISLYHKLDVQSRQQAVARARALGILPQS